MNALACSQICRTLVAISGEIVPLSDTPALYAHRCARGGMGLRIQWSNPWGFESPPSHLRNQPLGERPYRHQLDSAAMGSTRIARRAGT